MYFPLKDQNDIFRIGVAVSDKPEGPFIPESDPIKGSHSIDPAVLEDNDGKYYIYFGGLWGGQLQRYRNNKAIECGQEPADDQPALSPKVALLSDNMLEFGEEPKDALILDENGQPLVKDKAVTGFTNTEEDAVQLTSIVPFLLEDELNALGGDYQKVEDWHPFVVQDGLLITGQNPASSLLAAEKLVTSL